MMTKSMQVERKSFISILMLVLFILTSSTATTSAIA